MKRFRFVPILLISLFLFSCSNSFQGNLLVSESNSNKCTLLVKSKNDIINFSANLNSQERTILPTSIDSSTLHFYLWGTNKITGESLNITEVEFTPTESNTTGTIDFNFANSTSYELYLGATKSVVSIDDVFNSTAIENVKKELCYIGFATVDLRYTTKILFFLSPYAVDSAYGSASLKLYTTWDIPDSYRISAGLYDKNTDQEVIQYKTIQGGNVYPSTKQGIQDFTVNHSVPTLPNYTVDHITPGTYNFKVSFVGTKKTFIYSDTIVILANQETTATIAVPNIIEYAPNNPPTEFTAAYADPDSNKEDFYSIEFAWKDNSYNESHFNLEILDISNVTDNVSNKNCISTIIDTTGAYSLSDKNSAWGSLIANRGFQYIFNPDYYGDSSNPAFIDVCSDGALCLNNEYIVVNLMLGKKYLARICSVNDMGSSDYAYIDICNDGNYQIPSTTLSKTFQNFENGTISINRYRINYNLNNGRFKDLSIGKDVTSSINTYCFDTQNTLSSKGILTPIDYNYDLSDSNKKATLRYNDKDWTKWNINGINGDEQGPVYNGYENLNLFAYYDGSATNNNTNVTVNNFKVFAGTSSTIDTTNEIPITNNYFVVDSNLYTHIYLLSYNHDDGIFYTYSPVKINISDKYGTMTEYICSNRTTIGFNEYDYIVIDISDNKKYSPNNQIYYVEYCLSPTNDNSEDIYYTIKFRIQ